MIRADRQTYLSGMGNGVTLKAADQAALTEIVEQTELQSTMIFVTVSQPFVESGLLFRPF